MARRGDPSMCGFARLLIFGHWTRWLGKQACSNSLGKEVTLNSYVPSADQ
jgi:hypothetical protein